MNGSRRLPTGALFLLVGAVIAAAAGSPYRGEADVSAYVAARFQPSEEIRSVSPELLGRWIMQRRPGFQVVDVRGREAWTAYHIPGALQGIGSLPPESSGPLVLCSEGEQGARDQLKVLRAAGRDSVYVLEGGMVAWTARILHPAITAAPSPWARAMFEAIAPISRHLGGVPRRGVPAGQATLRDLPPRLDAERGGDGGRALAGLRRGC